MSINRTMRLGSSLLAAAFLSSSAYAQERPAIQSLTCQSAKDMVSSQGEVVFATGPNGMDRIVRDGAYCGLEETTAPDYQRSSDQQSCFVGYRCKPTNRGENSND